MEIVSTSPNKRFELRADVWEARNSLWVNSPSIWDTDGDRRVLSFNDETWSIETNAWLDEVTVRIMVRKFPGDHYPDHLRVEIDCVALTAVVLSTAELPAIKTPLASLEETLENALSWR